MSTRILRVSTVFANLQKPWAEVRLKTTYGDSPAPILPQHAQKTHQASFLGRCGEGKRVRRSAEATRELRYFRGKASPNPVRRCRTPTRSASEEREKGGKTSLALRVSVCILGHVVGHVPTCIVVFVPGPRPLAPGPRIPTPAHSLSPHHPTQVASSVFGHGWRASFVAVNHVYDTPCDERRASDCVHHLKPQKRRIVLTALCRTFAARTPERPRAPSRSRDRLLPTSNFPLETAPCGISAWLLGGLDGGHRGATRAPLQGPRPEPGRSRASPRSIPRSPGSARKR